MLIRAIAVALLALAAMSMQTPAAAQTVTLRVHQFLPAGAPVPKNFIAEWAKKVEQESGNTGFNARAGVFEDLLKAGVIDPAKVTRAALQNAASIASLLLTTEVLIADKPEEAGAGGGMPDMGGMGGMGGMM